ncbi:MarR family transcriptional regulator [Nocardia sp. NPDC052278]|uniref:MarR family transcriptional regulator n=1 Tax=unclassified Nocardia TaxID=2637762 RepID=UPI0036A5816C
MNTFAILRLVVIKGRVDSPAIAESLGLPVEQVDDYTTALTTEGHLKQTPAGYRATPQGRDHANELVTQERAAADSDAVDAAYSEFCVINSDFKALITDWQLRGGTPNDHSDTAYDADVLDRLRELHHKVRPLIERIGALTERLTMYGPRLDRALQQISNGDLAYVARPIMDSYHTVWFELHEDLIGLAGLTRADEAAAGRGA